MIITIAIGRVVLNYAGCDTDPDPIIIKGTRTSKFGMSLLMFVVNNDNNRHKDTNLGSRSGDALRLTTAPLTDVSHISFLVT